MMIFKRCVVRMGNRTVVNHGDGQWLDLGDVSGKDLLDFCIRSRLPLMRVAVDARTLPQPVAGCARRAPWDSPAARYVEYVQRKVVGRY